MTATQDLILIYFIMHFLVERSFCYYKWGIYVKLCNLKERIKVHGQDGLALLSVHVCVQVWQVHLQIPSLTLKDMKQNTQVSLIRSHLCGQVKRPEEKSKHTACHHGNDRERQQPIPLAVVLHICPDLCGHQTLPKFGHTFHPDSDAVVSRQPPTPPPGGLGRYPKILTFSRRISADPTRYEAESS